MWPNQLVPHKKATSQMAQISPSVVSMTALTKWVLRYIVVVLVCISPVCAGDFEVDFRKQVSAFLNSLDRKQAGSCLLDLEDERRWRMHYPGGKRPGIQISQLSAPQRSAMEKALRLVLSSQGWKMANAVAAQDSEDGGDALGKYWITCFGDPRGGDFAFRLAEHHLTIVQLELIDGEAGEFGPILLGANPPSLWREDEELLIRAWKLIDDERALILDKKGIAGRAMPEDEGVMFVSLNQKGRDAIKRAWEHRLEIFTLPIRQRINKLHESLGGWQKSRLAYYHEAPAKRCIDGGRWDFKCGLPGMVWDFESSRAHIHMSMWVRTQGK